MKRLALLGIWILCQGAAVIAALWMLSAIIFGSDRAWRIAIGYDQLANVTTGGSEDETISSRAGRNVNKKTWCILCKLLDFVEKDHCKNSIGI